MTFAHENTKDKAKAAAVAVLGPSRVKSVESLPVDDGSGAPAARIKIYYWAAKGLTVPEMDKIINLLWPIDRHAGSVFPVVDFIEDTELGVSSAQ